MTLHRIVLLISLVALMLHGLAPRAHAEVVTVEHDGIGANNLQFVVDATSNGDTLLIGNGNYRSFKIVGKGLTVIADGDDVRVDTYGGDGSPAIEIRDQAPGHNVLIRGVRTNMGLQISNSAGRVWIDEVTVEGGPLGLCVFYSTAGADIENSPRVTFTRCAIRGGLGRASLLGTSSGAAGLYAQSSTVQLWDCELLGGWGGNAADSFEGPQPPMPGGAGLLLEGSVISLYGCAVSGGAGGLDNPVCGGAHAQGGVGLDFVGAPSTLRRAQSTIQGGQADIGLFCPGELGPPGAEVAGSGTMLDVAGGMHHLSTTSPVRGGETVSFDFVGLAGDIPALFVSTTHEPVQLDPYGILLIGLPQADAFVLGPLPASGQATLAFPAPNLAALSDAIFYAQSLFLSPGPVLSLGAGTTLVLLGAGI